MPLSHVLPVSLLRLGSAAAAAAAATAAALLVLHSPGPAAAGPPARALAPVASSVADPVGVWPLDPEPAVLDAFDPPADPWGAGHRGVDLLGRPGQPVRSALAGTVSFAGMLAGRGVVVVDHGPTRTTYQPVSASARVGEEVAAGAVLGALEAAGSHCAPRSCLHWGWIEGASTYLDPLRLVGAGPIRLLPLWRDRPLEPAGSAGSARRAPLWPATPLRVSPLFVHLPLPWTW